MNCCIFCGKDIKSHIGYYEDVPNRFVYHIFCWWIVRLLNKLHIKWGDERNL